MIENKLPSEELAGWKAPEQSPEKEGATPEALIEQVPEQDRGVLRRLGEKVLGRGAVSELTQAVRTQAGLLRELGSGLKTPIDWGGIDRKKALAYGAYLFVGAVAAELGSPDSAEAAEGEHDQDLKQIMIEAMPHTPDGGIIPLDQLTESQQAALGVTYELRQKIGAEGGTPALYEMQTEDMWRVQQQIGADTKNYQYETSRATDVHRWGERIMQQYEAQKGMPEQELALLDSAVGAVEEIEGISAQERLLFKEAALKAITESNGDAGQIKAKIDGLLRVTEMLQGQKFYNQQSENHQLESVYQQVLAGELDKPAVAPTVAEAGGVRPEGSQAVTIEKSNGEGEGVSVIEGEITPEEIAKAQQGGRELGVGIVRGEIKSMEDFVAAVERIVGNELSASDQKSAELTYRGVASKLGRGIDDFQINKITTMLTGIFAKS